MDECNIDNDPPPLKAPKSSIQPFWMEYLAESYKETKQQLLQLTNYKIKFNIAETSGVVKLKVDTPELYRTVQDFLKDRKINCYSLRPKSEKPLKYVVKGFDTTYSPEEFRTALVNEGFQVLKVSRMRSFKADRRLLPMIFVEIKNIDNSNTRMANLSYLDHTRVFIEVL